jgi:DNA helicase II / ATP-dependent DNA helicase PcrA
VESSYEHAFYSPINQRACFANAGRENRPETGQRHRSEVEISPVTTSKPLEGSILGLKMTPSPQQEAIFADISGGEGHTCVVARAGSGKTSTIVAGLNCIPQEIPRNETLMVAFNKSIAAELKTRAPDGVEVATLHSYGLRQIGYNLPRRPAVDGEKLSRIVSTLSSNRDVKAELRRVVGFCKANLAHSAIAVDRMLDEVGIVLPEGVGREEMVDLTRAALKESRKDVATVDFDDMIWFPCVFDWGMTTYARVFVDETQDLNSAQVKLALGACRPGGRILAVGDDKQAIYAFRGADAQAIPNLVRDLKARTLPLTTTYRCAKAITALAARYVPDFECPATAPDGEVNEIVGWDSILRGARPGDAVLSRTNAELVRLCFAFIRAGIRGVSIQGKDVGGRLLALVRKARTENVAQLREWVAKWRDSEIERLIGLDRDPSGIADTAETLLVITEGCDSVSRVVEKVEALFTDDAPSHRRIVLSSTHKFKGLERERVWLLRDTYLRTYGRTDEEDPQPSQENINIYYVAVTRAKTVLNLVWEK